MRQQKRTLGGQRLLLLALTLMLAGRGMTIAFLGRIGGAGAGDPPEAWLMPLVGDAIIGVSALPVAYLIWRGRGLSSWTVILAWNVAAIWDALSAFLVHLSVPWPQFFMIEIFGSSMFFAASAMHASCIYILWRPERRREFSVAEG